MKGRVILILEDPDLPAMAARLEEGKLVDLLVDPPEDDLTPRPGAIHMAQVTRVAPGMGAVFLDLGGGREGFLKNVRGLRAGDSFPVQISRHAEAGKAVPVNAEPLYKGRYAILTPHAPGLNVARKIRDADERARLAEIAGDALAEAGLDCGLIVRSAADGADPLDVMRDVLELARILRESEAADEAPGEIVAAASAEVTAWRDWTEPQPDEVIHGDARLFDDFGVWDAVDALLAPRVSLPGGGWMTIEATTALIAVDVNTGPDFSPAAALKTNLAAADELPRQLLLRGIGGQVVIDFAPASKRERPKIEAALKRALRADPVDTTLAGWTPLGNVELLRKRERRPLAELIRGPVELPPRGKRR